MKQIALLTLLLLFALFGAACATAATAPQTAAATASGAPAPAASGAGTEVDITLADNTINSSATAFKAGVTYTFVIKNHGNHLHNFNIAQPLAVTGSEDASLASALLVVTQDKLPIGGGTTVSYTFPGTAAGMPLEFSCLIKRHYEDGMRLGIIVTK